MSPFLSAFVVVLTLINILAVALLLWWLRRGRGESTAATPETTGHVWDGDLREYNNPLPRWWLGLFVISVIFALGYLVLYPGLGNFRGVKGWSQIEQYRQQTQRAEALLARTFEPFEHQSVKALAKDPAALRVGRNLFMNNCAQCHGSDARGAPGFPNLTDADWLWGGAPEAIMDSISNGRTGVMSPWATALGEAGVEDVLAYVLSLSGRTVPAGDAVRGKQKFGEICFACHDTDGRGSQAMGAPNLTDKVWLHGGSIAAVRDSIAKGRHGEMPAHLERLGGMRVKLLAAYVMSLGGAAQRTNSEAGTPALEGKEVPLANGSAPDAPSASERQPTAELASTPVHFGKGTPLR